MTTKQFSIKLGVPTILLLFGINAAAQQAKIDSLKKDYNNAIKTSIADGSKRIDSLTRVLKNAKDTIRINTLNELSNTYRWINSDTGLVISAQAFEEAIKMQFKRGMMRATRISMLIYMNRGDLNKYEEYAHKSVPILQELKNYRFLHDSYMRIGDCLYQKMQIR